MTADADLLRRAAALVRERATAATPGPLTLMRYDNRNRGGRLCVLEDEGSVWGARNGGRRVLVADFFHEGDREWYAATVTPGIGEPLADLLAAAAFDDDNHNQSGALRSAFTDYALDVARAVIAAGEIGDRG